MDLILIAAGAAFVSFVVVAFALVRRDPPQPGPDPRLEAKRDADPVSKTNGEG
ncbi:MAG: hypothetical protein AAF447_00475 [Myxococcota bacterium]